MAIRHNNSNGSNEMTVEQFKRWIKSFDTDGDGKISRAELREVIRHTGAWFSTWKSDHGLKQADTNRNGVIDDNEIENLVAFARKKLGMKIAAY